MVNINLAESAYQKDNKPSIYNKGAVVLFVILAILIAGYFVISFTQKSVTNKISEANKVYAQEHAKLLGSRNKDIVDFQNRMTVAKTLINQDNAGARSLPGMEKAILPGVFLKSLDFKRAGDSVEIEGVADNFDALAKQIASFKRSDYFSGMTVGETKLDENGKVDFFLSLNIK